MLRYVLSELINDEPVTQGIWNFDVYLLRRELELLRSRELNAIHGVLDEFLVPRYRLPFEPHIQLALDVLHFKIGIAQYSPVVSQHALALYDLWDSFTPYELQSHAQ